MSLQLSSNQQVFAGELSSDTGLNLGVIDAWLRNEEPAEASNGQLGANNFLNIGITGPSPSQWYGNTDAIWNSPTTAADATAAWLEGKPSVAGYGTASSGIQGILSTAKSSPSAQISAIQGSGWASGGETALPTLYNEATGGTVTLPGVPGAATLPAVPAGGTTTTPTTTGGTSSSNSAGGLFGPIINDAKYAGVFVLVLAIGGFLIMKGISTNGGPKVPTSFVPVPV